MSEFISVAKVGDIPEGEGRSYPVNGTMVAIFLSDGEYKAISDFCPHMGSSMAGGHVEANSVTCPWHAWRFCIDDGLWLDNPKSNIRVPCYDVRVVGDDIQVNVPVEEPIEPATDEPPTDEPAGPPATNK
jgi:nitrite reductase (NADH) small subunit